MWTLRWAKPAPCGHKAWPVKVRYTRRALRQMTDILDHIEAHSPRGAENVRRRLQAVVEMSLTIPRS